MPAERACESPNPTHSSGWARVNALPSHLLRKVMSSTVNAVIGASSWEANVKKPGSCRTHTLSSRLVHSFSLRSSGWLDLVTPDGVDGPYGAATPSKRGYSSCCD